MPERKPRQRITFADRLARLDRRLARARQLVDALEHERDNMIELHRSAAEAMLKEAGVE